MRYFRSNVLLALVGPSFTLSGVTFAAAKSQNDWPLLGSAIVFCVCGSVFLAAALSQRETELAERTDD